MMTDRDRDELARVFAQARGAPVTVRETVMACVLTDAARVQPAVMATRAARRRRGAASWLRDLVGGWPALGGVMAAGLTGLWLGIAPPSGVESLTASLIGTTQIVIFLPDADLSLFEDLSDG